MRDLEAEFRTLAEAAGQSSGMSVLEIGPGVAVARDSSSSRIVLVEVGDDPVRVRDRQSAGVWLTSVPRTDGRSWLALECRDERLADVFVALADEIVTEVSDVERIARRAVVQGHLERWRKLFMRGAGERMSRQAEIGLHGELAVLELFADHNPNLALEAWTGPRQSQHDYRWSDRAIEVKTTEAKEGFTVTVHGLTQLEVPVDDVSLHLAGVRVLEDVAGRTLPQVVAGLMAKVDAQVLLDLLLHVDYDHAAADDHSWAPVVVDRLDFWQVSEDIPALRASTLPAAWRTAISGVSYQLDLGALGVPMAPNDVEALWGN